MGKGKLHELLAVESDCKRKAKTIAEETIKTFNTKKDHFDGLTKTYHPFDDNEMNELPPEIKEIVTTVGDKLAYTSKALIAGIEAHLSKEETNASNTAKAELIIDKISFGELSATSLLALEQHVSLIRNIILSIPTLDPTKQWTKDDSEGKGIYKTSAEVNYRTTKRQVPITLAKATTEHPAQVQLLTEDTRVGKYETVYSSGKVTPKLKSNMLEKVDSVMAGVKRARTRANNIDVVKCDVGKKIVDYIFSD